MRRYLIVTMLLAVMSSAGCGVAQMAAIHVNNVHHMTIERAMTPRFEKRFRVLDGLTLDPVAGARIVAVHDFDWMDDWVMNATTDAEGVATIRLAREYLHLLRVEVMAVDGYIPRSGSPYFREGSPVRAPVPLTTDLLDLYVYRRPATVMGLRVPAGFVGTVVYQLGSSDGGFPAESTLQGGRRVWWTDVAPGAETVVTQPPRLENARWDGNPVQAVTRGGGEAIPVPEPGAELAGVAAWHVGVREPSRSARDARYVVVIGDRAAALAKAKDEWDAHGNGEAGFIYNGWLRVIGPGAERSERGGYSVWRNVPPR